MPRTQLFVKGRKDGVMREVRHIPIDGDTKHTQVMQKAGDKLIPQPDHFHMLLGHPATALRQIINKGRIIAVVIPDAAGLPL